MKKSITIVSVVALFAFMAVAAGPFSSGWGKTVTVSPDAVATTLTNTVGSLSVFNTSGFLVHAQANTSMVAFSNAVAAGTAVPIPNNSSFTFDGKSKNSIQNVFVKSAVAATGTVYLGGF
jgi:hypothetical protein